MLVLVVYDINTTYKYGEKRLAKVAKKCQSYGRRVQNSTYECLIDQSQFLILKSSILDIIEEKVDSVRFYICLLYTSPSPRDPKTSRMPSAA